MPARATMALINEPLVITSLGFRSSLTICTINLPVSWAVCNNLESGAGVPATPGIVMPKLSATQPIVDAVPMVLQCPRLLIIDCSDLRKSSSLIFPARSSSLNFHTSVPQPKALPL